MKKISSEIKQTKSQIETMESEQDKLFRSILAIDEKDEAEADRIGGVAIRAFS